MTADPFDDLAEHFMTGPDAPAGSGDIAGSKGPADRSAHNAPRARSQQTPLNGAKGGARAWGGVGEPGLDRLRVGGRARVVRSAPVTVIICGNLPSQAGLWMSQFVDRAARQVGPIGLLRLSQGEVRGEVFRTDGRAIPVGSGWISRVNAFAQRWMVCVPDGVAAKDVIACAPVIEFLTGADEAALAAARLRLELLVNAARDAGRDDPLISVTVMGAPEPQASQASQSLIEWADIHLQANITSGGTLASIDRIETAGAVELFELTGKSLAEVIAALAGDAVIDGGALPSAANARTAPVTAPAPAAPEAAFAPPDAAALQPAAASAPVPRSAVTSAPMATGLLTDLFEGFTALPFRAPHAPLVELARDREGGLRLLSRDHSLCDLRIARAWLEFQRVLIASAANTAPDAAVTEHVVLGDAKLAVALHGCGALLHICVELRADGVLLRRRVDLNDRASGRVT
ncbi:MAG: hypothetical protein EXS00_01135 [Phycisphaerales bacterium]|nr:hypothetical protein [Phycisphaerales bacterium]